jgi:hypothetical protein
MSVIWSFGFEICCLGFGCWNLGFAALWKPGWGSDELGKQESRKIEEVLIWEP